MSKIKKACSLHLAYNNSTFRDGHKKVKTFFHLSHTHTQSITDFAGGLSPKV